MTRLYRLSIHPSVSMEKAWSALEEVEIEILYGSEEEGHAELYAYLLSPEELSPFQWIEECSPYTLPSIDWEAQWTAHAHNFHDGFVVIDFENLGRKAPALRLQPGAGFGDLSHPTTQLMLNMLIRHVKNQIVIDIGCGSGILTCAAALLGAPKVYGVDIDPDAIEHSKKNALLNHLSEQCLFCEHLDFHLPDPSRSVLILMNMISSEQSAAWASQPSLHHLKGDCLTSGIPKEERERYLENTSQWGWELQQELEESGWLAFHFKIKH